MPPPSDSANNELSTSSSRVSIQSIINRIITEQPLPTFRPPQYTAESQSPDANTPLLSRHHPRSNASILSYDRPPSPRTNYRSLLYPLTMTPLERLVASATRLGGGYVPRDREVYAVTPRADVTEEEVTFLMQQIRQDAIDCGIIEGSFLGSLCFCYGTALVICTGSAHWVMMPSCFAAGCGFGYCVHQAERSLGT